MAVPEANRFYRAVLEIAAEAGRSLSVREIIEMLPAKLRLLEEDLKELVPSKTQTRVENRTYWSISKLKKAGLLEVPVRGQPKITRKGQEFLAHHQGEIQNSELARLAVSEQSNDDYSRLAILDEITDDFTPDEQLATSYQAHLEMLADETLENVKGISPSGFERLVVELLARMGYGDGNVVGRSGDQGIDGILNQDTLGLEKIYVQAKRFDNAQIGEPEIRNFSGSLDPHGATKGVFITTSTFSASARQTAENISRGGKFIRLIDGSELAGLMISHTVGVVTEITYEVKKLDANYFAEL
ncbi:MAG: restriction endonuclease [Chloroflexota bacterium]|nr:restriction endonuclease [Chloroflexota bacterium]